MLGAIFGMLVSTLLFYNNFFGYLEKSGYEFNPYDPCVSDRVAFVNQHTVRFHVDDVISSHVNPKVNDKFK